MGAVDAWFFRFWQDFCRKSGLPSGPRHRSPCRISLARVVSRTGSLGSDTCPLGRIPGLPFRMLKIAYSRHRVSKQLGDLKRLDHAQVQELSQTMRRTPHREKLSSRRATRRWLGVLANTKPLVKRPDLGGAVAHGRPFTRRPDPGLQSRLGISRIARPVPRYFPVASVPPPTDRAYPSR